MLTAEAYQKMSIAKAITMVELDRIDAHTHLQGAPLTVCTVEGLSYRVPEKMQGLARKAFEALARGCVPDLGKGKLYDVLKAAAGEDLEEEPTTVALVANALADRALDAFAAEFRCVLMTKLKDKHDHVLQEVFASLLD